MSASFVYDQRKAYGIERKLLLYCGIYPNRGQINKYLYYLSGFIIFLVTMLTQASATTLIALHINNLSAVAEGLMFTITHTAYIFKLVNVIWNRNLFCQMEEILSNPIFYRSSYKNANIIRSYVEPTKRYAIFYRVICALVCITNGTLQLVGSKFGHAMVLGWNPWDSSIKYYINCLFQWVGLMNSACINSTIDILTVMLITVATAQIESLKNNLASINYSHPYARHEFNENVRLHYEILRFVNTVEDTFSFGILIQIFASVLVICFTGFQMINVYWQSIQFWLLCLYFMCMMFQVTMYCWFGHYLIASSDAIIYSVYMTNWYESDTKLKRSIMVFMERCKKPIVLRAGGLFPLSLTTLTSVIRSSYSYFAVLRRLYEPEMENL